VRLPADLVAAVEHACREHNISPSELLRSLVSQWVYGDGALKGPEAGYAEARSMATRLAHVALKEAIKRLPLDHDRANSMLQGFYSGAGTPDPED
jgi:hypothetical protein